MTGPEWLDAARALARIEQFRTIDAQELLDYAMTQAIAVTDSAFGYVYHYDEDEEVFVNHAWSEQVMEHCHVDDPRVRYELKATGVWGDVVRQRRPILLNDFAGSPLLRGFPEGHIPVVRWMSAPVIVDSRIVAVVGVANKESDYTEDDATRLTALLEVIWSVAQRLESANLESERRRRNRAITANAALAEQRERSRLAMELHDEIAQPLAALLLYLQVANERADEGCPELQKAISIAQDTLGASRRFVTELSPQVLESIGLAAGIEWLANEAFAGQIDCTIRDECDAGGLNEEANLLLFQVVRETLQNVVKHAEVREAEIAWSSIDGSFVLEVRDEGVGFDPKAIRRDPDRFGLLSLRARAEHLGGVLIIDSGAGNGTLVRIILPLEPILEKAV